MNSWTPEQLEQIAKLQNGDCIFCERSGLKVPLSHINKSHDTPEAVVREMLSVSMKHRLCPEEESNRRRAQMQSVFDRFGNFSPFSKGHAPYPIKRKTAAMERADAMRPSIRREMSMKFHDSRETDHDWDPFGDPRLTYVVQSDGKKACLICYIRHRYTHPSIIQVVNLLAELTGVKR